MEIIPNYILKVWGVFNWGAKLTADIKHFNAYVCIQRLLKISVIFPIDRFSLSQYFANKDEGFYESGFMKSASKWQQIIEQAGAYLFSRPTYYMFIYSEH